MRKHVEIFSGTVSSLVYENDDFKIVRLIIDNDSNPTPVSCKGNFPAQEISIGTWVSFEGYWDNHPQYGRQLTVTRSPVSVSHWTDERVLSALSANGVGPSVRASIRALAKKQKTTLQKVLDSGSLEGSRIEEFAQAHAISRWRSIRTYLDAASFMQEANIPASVIGKVWKKFGSEIETHILNDPWVLVRVGGISFKEADQIAIRLGVGLDNPGRVRGAVLSAVRENVFGGHVFATTRQVVSKASGLIQSPSPTSPQIADAIKTLVEDGLLVLDRDTKEGVRALYDKWHWDTEVECAQLLFERSSEPLPEDELRKAFSRVSGFVEEKGEDAPIRELAGEALAVWSKGTSHILTEDQKEAAVDALVSAVSLLTGLPGTGKTTTLMAVVSIARDMGIPYLLVAPTGIAAKRMSSVTGSSASTVHRAFGAKGFMKDEEARESTYVGVTGSSSRSSSEDPPLGEWGYGPDNPHPARLVVVDETSMLDLHMLYRLLTATRKDCRLVFVGDPYQLPSVGAGDVLRNMVSSGTFPHTHLDEIFRQSGTSGIVHAAHRVHKGLQPNFDTDFALVTATSEDAALGLVVRIARKLYDKRANFQVLSPRHAGDAGVTSLNENLRSELNPSVSGSVEMRFGGGVVREGDRVMVVRNDYENGVYNGDIGKVDRIDRKAKEVSVKIFEGAGRPPKIIRYPFKNVSKMLRLAYAQTVHKSQGQEYDAIVIPVLRSFGRQLQRNLFYTAITRAKKKVVLVGEASAVRRAVENNQAQKRNTLLSERLQNLSEGNPNG